MSYSVIKVEREADLPLDSVQRILWDPTDRYNKTIITAGWDGCARVYAIQGTTTRRLEKIWEFFFGHPVISCDVNLDGLMFAGLATGDIILVDMKNTQNCAPIGSHNAPICMLAWVDKFKVLLSLGYDDLLKVFSLERDQQGNHQIAEYKLPAKTNTGAFSDPYLLIGSQDGRVAILNVQQLQKLKLQNQFQQICDPHHGIVKYSCCAISGFKRKFALGTPDGRLIHSVFNQGYNGLRIDKPVVTQYQKSSKVRNQCSGQMNSIDIGFKDAKHEFCIFGGTEQSCYYSFAKNNKIKSVSSSNYSATTALAISPDCEYVAWATGSDWTRGLDELASLKLPKLNVTRITSSDVAPSSYER